MGIATKFAAAVFATTALTTTAMAADLYTPVDPVVYEEPSGDWEGFYAGVFGSYNDWAGGDFGGGARVGYNFDAGDFVFGLEGSFAYYPDISGGTSVIEGDARFGFDAGQALIYGLAGLGQVNWGGTTNYYTVGGGVEFMVTDMVSIGGEYKWRNTGSGTNIFNVGVNVHLD
jgi:outer membrane immunogenic protein